MGNIKSRTDQLIQRLNSLGTISDDSECLARFFGMPSHEKARQQIAEWMEEAGMQTHIDNMGNVRGILSSQNPEAPHFVIGSHYDSVYDAGNYDGPLGILMGIEMAQYIYDQQISLPFHLNIVAFADEEGGRFNTAYLGSCVLAGNFDPNWLERKDENGLTLNEVIKQMGGNTQLIQQDQIPSKDWMGYFEIHIEQGPVLCDQDQSVCLVSGIAGQTRVDIYWEGMAGHAGTSPMDLRKDALCAAAEFTLEVEALGKENKENLVATVGKLKVTPNSSNVIPGAIYCTLDIRSMKDGFLRMMVEQLEQKAQAIATRRGLQCTWKIMQSNPSVKCDDFLTEQLRSSIQKVQDSQPLEIPSGAGHDGVMIAKVAPISMLFVRCREGISHHPSEFVERKDIEKSLEVCDHFLKSLIQSNQ